MDEEVDHGRPSVDRSEQPPQQCNGDGHGGTDRAEMSGSPDRSDS